MELILNELSFDGQFSSQDEFIQYVLDILMPLLDVVIENEIPLLKKSDLYQYMITCDSTLQDLLMRTDDPSMTLLKSYIVNLGYCEPYWDLETLMTDPEGIYEYPASANEPNCFTEVIERSGQLLSLPHPDFDADMFLCRRDSEEFEISNIKDLRKLLKEILSEDKEKICYIIERYPYQWDVRCAQVNQKCFAKEALLDNNLAITDLLQIVDSIAQLMDDLGHGRKSRLWDKLQDDIFELRLHVSSDRIFSLFFIQSGGLVFLNGFVKKTQKTPAGEIAKAREIIKQIMR